MNTIRRVLAFLFRHWRSELSSVWGEALCVAAATVADLIVPIYSGRLVDAITVPSARRAEGLHAAVVAIAMIVVMAGLSVTARYGMLYFHRLLNLRLMKRFTESAFLRVQRFATDWHSNSFAGAIVRKITRGLWATDTLINTLLIGLWPALVVLIGSTVILGARWLSMGVIMAVGAMVYIALSVSSNVRIVAPAFRLANAQDTRLGGALADAITCNAVVKSFGAEEREDERLENVLKKWFKRTMRAWTFIDTNSSVQLIVLLMLRVGVISYAVLLWWQRRATAGDVIFVLTSYGVIHAYLFQIGQHVANLQKSANEMEDMVEFESQPFGIDDFPGAERLRVTRGEIVFDEVVFKYGARPEPLFNGLNLTIEAGERVGLVGHSGSGKTTFVKLLHRLYDIQAGSILVDRQNIAEVTQASLRSQIALVPQDPILFHRSLAENIAYARPTASMREIEEAARLAHAHEFIIRQPKGYSTLVGERGVKLSGGERQRVALARAFLANTPILILDEATSALDSESEHLIQEAMERLMMGRTAIVVAHRLSTVRMLDRILVFDDGEIIEDGRHETLVRSSDGVYKRLFERQALGLLVELDEELSVEL